MSRYRRCRVPGGRYFFTVVTRDRRPLLCRPETIPALRSAFREVMRSHPFRLEAVVILPDHLHAIWALPPGDADFSTRWRAIKKRVTCKLGMERQRLWQPRFWEHWLRDEEDWRRHLDYIHYNPVKHGLVPAPVEWPWSSFHRMVAKGWYPPEWGRHMPDAIRGMEFE